MSALALVSMLWMGCYTPQATPPEPEPTAGHKRGKRHGAKEAARQADTPGTLEDEDEPDEEVAPKPPAPQAPNVLLIVLDTVRADHMSLYGYDKPTTPLLEAWAAKNAVVYERAVSPAVWTLPSHASLFTTLPVRTHGVDASHTRLDEQFTSLPAVLSAAGFDTFAFCSNPYIMKETRLLEGFDTKERPWQLKWRTKVKRHIASKLIRKDASTPLSPKWPHGGSNNKYLYKEAGPIAAEATVAWIQGRAEPARPWFAFINLMEAHLPRIPTLTSRKAVMTPEEIERSYGVEQTTEAFHAWMADVDEMDDLDLAAIRGVYDASLIDLDLAVMDLLDGLDARGMLDNTLVVITSDHGEHLGEHDLLLHKYGVYNALSHVPLLMSWRGHLEPGRVAEVFSVANTMDKVITLGRLPVPDEVRTLIAQRPGAALPGAVTEFNAIARASLIKLIKSYPGVDRSRFKSTYQALELGAHKLIDGSDGTAELFDVLADPGELQDLAATQPKQLATLQQALDAWRAAVPRYTPREGEPEVQLDEELKEGLEALGYVQ